MTPVPEPLATRAESRVRGRRLGLADLELRWRLSLAIGLLLSAVLAAAAWVAVRSARSAVVNEVSASLETATASLDLLMELLPARGAEGEDARIESVLQLWAASYAHARHLCVTLEAHGRVLGCPPRAEFEDVPGWFLRGADFEPAPVIRERALSSEVVRVRLVADPREELREAWLHVRGQLLLMGVLAFAVNLCVFLAISLGLRPLHALTRAMDQIGRGQAPSALPRQGPPEVRALASGLSALEQRIVRAREQVRALHLRNLDLQEDERRMVARELHDEIGQHVTAIEMETIRLARLAPQDREQREARLVQLRASVAEIHRVSRRLVHRLRPPSIESLGLVGALEALFERWRADHPEPVLSAEIDPACDQVADERGVHLYRIVQESLSNAARHAQARTIGVRVAIEGDQVVLRVVDDGRGFDPAQPAAGYGLVGMRERVEALAGRFAVHARRGAGTAIEARFALR